MDGDPDVVVPGLMAVGEASCASVHGANRLGGNSLIDLVVFGRAAAHTAAELVQPGTGHKPLPADAGEAALTRLDKVRNASGSEGDRRDPRRHAAHHAALRHRVPRGADAWPRAARRSARSRTACAELRVDDRSKVWNSDVVEALELQNLMLLAVATMHSAELPHREPRGARARGLSPSATTSNWMKHTTVWVDAGYRHQPSATGRCT